MLALIINKVRRLAKKEQLLKGECGMCYCYHLVEADLAS